MIISWIIYFILAVATGAFFILYKDLLALVLLLSVLCIPFILLLIHSVSFFLTKITVEIDDKEAGLGKPVKILIKVKNSSPFAVTHIKVFTKCTNLFLNAEHDCKFIISAAPFSTKVFTYEMKSEHIGNIDFTLKKAVFYDYFSLFRLTRKIKTTKIIPVFPETVAVAAEIRPNNWFVGEADKFSNAKAGDDPSEVFNIREYIEGDKLNKVHWKLTSKADKYMIKEYSLPVSDNIFIYLDLKARDSNDESLTLIDSLVKSCLSVSLEFARKGIVHYIGWYNCRRNAFIKSKIKSEADVYLTISRVFSDTVFTSEPMLENCEFFLKNKYSHIILMSSSPAKEVEGLFAEFDLSLSLMSVVCVAYERTEAPSGNHTRFIPVIPNSEENCLYGIKF